MKRVYQYKEQRKLEVGKIYDFAFIKSIKLPDNEQYFVLQDPFGEKHLLPAKYYSEYNFFENNFYPCHVDKVNCQGRIFLEPLHPFFTIGNSYDFKFMGIEKYTNKKGQTITMNLMKSPNNYCAYLSEENNLTASYLENWHRYTVIKIKKSKVFIVNSK